MRAFIMPDILFPQEALQEWGRRWLARKAFERREAMQFGRFIDSLVAQALSVMLGDLPILTPGPKDLQPPRANCIEIGDVRIIGGVRPQNFDVAYRPDGPRIVFDSKTLNDVSSIQKNWQNMVNDLATEATTVHTRFPYTVVAFMVVIPHPALLERQQRDLVRTLERLAQRINVRDEPHLAEVISLVVWEPSTGEVLREIPEQSSPLRLERFASTLALRYGERFQGLPPHNGR